MAHIKRSYKYNLGKHEQALTWTKDESYELEPLRMVVSATVNVITKPLNQKNFEFIVN